MADVPRMNIDPSPARHKDQLEFAILIPEGCGGKSFDGEDNSLGEAISTVYRHDERAWAIIYGDIIIQMQMRWLEDLYGSLVRIVDGIEVKGTFTACLLSNLLTCQLDITTDGENLFVRARWTEAPDDATLVALQALPPVNAFRRDQVIDEIRAFLDVVRLDLHTAGYAKFFNSKWT